jgi:cytochrome c nitrite reductase small subunit
MRAPQKVRVLRSATHMSAWLRRVRSSTSAGTPAPDRPARHQWTIAAAAAVGLAIGLGLFTFVYARGASYLTNDPEACGNCHIMREHLSAWVKSSHRAVATCNDCHTPHNLIGKYVTKAQNGFWHSFYFTTGRFPDPLRITEGNREVTEGTCRYCHGDIVEAIDPVSRHAQATPTHRRPAGGRRVSPDVRVAMASLVPQGLASGSSPASGNSSDAGSDQLSCIRCHRYVGHLVR